MRISIYAKDMFFMGQSEKEHKYDCCIHGKVVFKIGDKKAVSNGAEITLNAAPEIINNRTLVPARAVSDAFGYDIEWDGERRLVEITTN